MRRTNAGTDHRRYRKLRSGGKMNEAVMGIGVRAGINSILFGQTPGCPLANFVDRRHDQALGCAASRLVSCVVNRVTKLGLTSRGPYRALSAKAIIPIIAGRLIGWRGDG